MADFNKTFPAVASLAGIQGEDALNKAARLYLSNKGIFDAIFKVVKGLFDKKKDAPVVAPVSTTSGPVTVVVTPTAPVAPVERIVSSLDLKLFYIERDKKVVVHDGDELFDKDAAEAVRKGKGNVGFGDRVHFDCTPSDQFGKPFEPGDEANKSLLRADGYPAFEESISFDGGDQGPIEVSSEYDDFGATPVLKAPRNTNDGKDHTVRYQRRIVNSKGVTVASNAVSYNLS